MSVPGFGQQGLQHGPGRLLVQPVLRRGGGGAEGLFQERHADALGAADCLRAWPASTACP